MDPNNPTNNSSDNNDQSGVQPTPAAPPPSFASADDVPPPPAGGQPMTTVVTEDQSLTSSNTTSTSTPTVPDLPPVITTSGTPSGGRPSGKAVATLLGIFLLIGGLAAGIILIRQQQLFQQEAALEQPLTGSGWTNLCGSPSVYPPFLDPGQYSCSGDCTAGGSGGSCNAPSGGSVYKFTCSGLRTECRENEDGPRQSAGTNSGCGTTVQVDAYTEPNCRDGSGNWICGDPTGFIVWYTGDCPPPSTTPTPTPATTPTPGATPTPTPSTTPTPGVVSCSSKIAYRNDSRNTPGNYYLENPIPPNGSVQPGEIFVYEIWPNITNTTYSITDVLPNGLEFMDAITGCNYNSTNRTISCTAPNSHAFRVRASQNISGSFTNTAHVIGNNSCSVTLNVANQSPVPTPGVGTAQCLDVRAYKVTNDTPGNWQNWVPLSATDLANLKSGDVVYFAAPGTSTYNLPNKGFDKAQFAINGQVMPEVTALKPQDPRLQDPLVEYYQRYQIPAGTSKFTIQARIHHTVLGWIGTIPGGTD